MKNAMLFINAYYMNLTPGDKILYKKCHAFHNDLYSDVFRILTTKLGDIYGIPHLQITTIKRLSIREVRMVKASLILIALDLDIDFKANPALIDRKLFFRSISFHNQIKCPNSFLS